MATKPPTRKGKLKLPGWVQDASRCIKMPHTVQWVPASAFSIHLKDSQWRSPNVGITIFVGGMVTIPIHGW